MLERFEPVSLAEMDSVALQDRTDTKFVLDTGQLHRALAGLAEHYRILDIDGVRLSRYRTLYFDTAGFTLYSHHHDRRRTRYKVRSREYLDTGLSCLEIKFRPNPNRTIKRRLQTPEPVTELNSHAGAFDFLRENLPPGTYEMESKLWNRFSRITLVSKRRQERVTLDIGLQFSACVPGTQPCVALPGIAVAEVKQAGHERTSEFLRLMRDYHIRSTAFSKYCIGASLLYPGLKRNNFNAQHRLLHKLSPGGSSDTH